MAKQASNQVVTSPFKIRREATLSIKKPEAKSSSKIALLDSAHVTELVEESSIKDNTTLTAKLIKENKVSHQKVLQDKLTQSERLTRHCYDIGPFQTPVAFEVWRKQNKINLASTRLLKKNISKASSYLVYYPPAMSFTESKKNVEILKRMGITDYWLFLKGEFKGAISLGLFTKESRALRFKEKLGNMGLLVKIKQRYKTETVLYTQILTEQKKFKEAVVISKIQTISECKIQQPVAQN